MDWIKRKGEKVGPIKDILHKFKYSFQGMAYCFTHETSFIYEALAIIAVVVLGILFNISLIEWVCSLVTLFLIMEIEALNTGIEATVDMVTEEYHPLAKIAKDCGSAATCFATFVALGTNIAIFLPYIINYFAK